MSHYLWLDGILAVIVQGSAYFFPTPKFVKAFDAASIGIAQRLKAGPLAPILFYLDKTWKHAYTVVHNFVDKEVQRALLPFTTNGKTKTTKTKADHKEKFILLDQMAHETQDPLDLRHEVRKISLPARRLEYLRHPDSWEALREEVRSVGDQPLIFDLIALKDTVLPSGGAHSQQSPVSVPKGTTALLNMYALHTHPELWAGETQKSSGQRGGQTVSSRGTLRGDINISSAAQECVLGNKWRLSRLHTCYGWSDSCKHARRESCANANLMWR
ncbi:hypothetical protein PMAA_031530 [Talaromyces marneffei ATCC 18224]|uniref:Uncharacterized protein n=1 Tax=Talaromyces marneffei (strain ATCC 18224 / CBS 334.59 / QM 7333) TaxID=441960 RepID=B6Q4V0_TALMQ|nr:hypothetical protein PMAA_031530 [Talaromyces marneffei ATCC 18224]